ncbi:MAG: hypothetical protein AB7F78_08725, partial [Hyphomicrobiaceae bacterium]
MPPRPTRRIIVAGLAAAAGGLAVGVVAGPAQAQRTARGRRRVPTRTLHEVGTWIVVASNDDVFVRIARSEMGQGMYTGLA